MNVRILHCGDMLENYYLCIEHAVAGFATLTPAVGDVIYFSVKVNGQSLIGARGIVEGVSDKKPWRNSKVYKRSFALVKMEFCQPFPIQGLSQFGGTYWAAKYLQGSKAIKDQDAVDFLNREFTKELLSQLHRF